MGLRGVLARNLRHLRGAQGLSQEELAGRAGLNRNYVGMIEREENAATVNVLERLAEVLSVRASELLDGDLRPAQPRHPRGGAP
jgi:transcriptional regulator with XRE-family HTH domain